MRRPSSQSIPTSSRGSGSWPSIWSPCRLSHCRGRMWGRAMQRSAPAIPNDFPKFLGRVHARKGLRRNRSFEEGAQGLPTLGDIEDSRRTAAGSRVSVLLRHRLSTPAPSPDQRRGAAAVPGRGTVPPSLRPGDHSSGLSPRSATCSQRSARGHREPRRRCGPIATTSHVAAQRVAVTRNWGATAR